MQNLGSIKEKNMTDTNQLVVAADQALYAAKQSGRNQSCLFARGKLFKAEIQSVEL